MKNSRHEQGGVVAFAVVGVLLAALLVGGIYFAKKQGEIAKSEAASRESQQIQDNAEKAAESEAKSNGNDNSTNQSNPSSASTGSSDSTSGAKGNDSSTGTATPSQTATRTPGDVPSTGPEDTLAIVTVMAVGAAGIWYYVASKRSVVQSALK